MAEGSVQLLIGGMSCAGCASAVERVLRKQPAVHKASVNLALETVEITFKHNRQDVDQDTLDAIAVIKSAGFTATLRKEITPSCTTQNQPPSLGWRVVLASILSAPFVLNMGIMVMGQGNFLPPWLQWALATPVVLWLGLRFHTGAIQALSRRSANMDVLVSLGTSVAYFYSLVALVTSASVRNPSGIGPSLHFEAAAMIITFVMFGKWLEERAKRTASSAIRTLMTLRPSEALIRRHGAEAMIPVDQVRIGDTFIIKPGASIPVDGTVKHGTSEVDESLISGESIPILKSDGSTVIAGSINGSGLLECVVTRVGHETTLGKIVALVATAQNGKAPIQRLVDQIAAIFVPTIIIVAALTFMGWQLSGHSLEASIVAAVSVLVVACPCAMGLATPAALVAGTGAAAKIGILIRDIETLERAANTNIVAFDKTGTLTEGKPQLVYVQAVPNKNAYDNSQLLKLAAAVEQGSEHPLAQGLIAAQEKTGLPKIHDFQAFAGCGVTAKVEGHNVLIGTAAMMQQRLIDFDVLQPDLQRQLSLGQTVSLIAIDNQISGIFGFQDTPRRESRQAISDLKAKKIMPCILSGDHPEAVASVAKDLGVTEYTGHASPADKAKVIQDKQSKGQTVAMVGDGINDAPALAQADISIAMGSGTDVAMETAGITLMRTDPRLVSAAINISRATRRTIHQNLFWAFAYNVIGIPLAAFGFLHPAFASGAMALSSVSVVANALRLTCWKP